MSDFSATAAPGSQMGAEDRESGDCGMLAQSLASFGANDLEAVVRRRHPVVAEVIEHLARFGPARMTGSGSAAFAVVPDDATARAAVAELPPGWRGWAVKGLSEHPLAAW